MKLNKRKYIIQIYILFVLVISGCKDKDSGAIIRIERENFKESSKLTGIDVKFNEALNPFFFSIIKDSIILITNRRDLEYCLELYSLKDHRKILSFGRRGKGVGELLSASYIQTRDDYIWIHDVSGKAMYSYQLDSLLLIKQKYQPKKYKLPSHTLRIVPFKDNLFLCQNRWFINSKKYKNDVDEFFYVPRKGGDTVSFEIKEGSYYPPNVNGTTIIPLKRSNNFFSFRNSSDHIDIYNDQLEITKSLVGPDNIEPEYDVYGDMLIYQENRNWEGYHNCFIIKNTIYAIYAGINGETSNDELYKRPVEVFKFGKNGELLHRYELDKFIFNIFVDSKEEYLYGTHFTDFGDYPQLIRFKL